MAEREAWKKVLDIIKSSPQNLYKLSALVVIGCMYLPYILLLIKWLPWIFAGYELYHYFPSGFSFVILGLLSKIKG